MKVKIGIVTTFWSKNYGAALQAFALQTFLENNGYEVVFINYQEKRIASKKVGNFAKLMTAIKEQRLLSFVNSVIIRIECGLWNRKYASYIEKRNRKFDDFTKNFLKIGPYCSKMIDIHEYYDDVHCFICGSDQIWNPLVYGYSDYHFLSFVSDKKKIAYAPSIAKNNLTFKECEQIVNKIKRLDYVSVRESISVKELTNYDNSISIREVLDPTFLLTREIWRDQFRSSKTGCKYILVYLLSYNQYDKSVRKCINNIAKEFDLRVIELPFSEKIIGEDKHWEKRFDVSPAEFMELLLGSFLVITNSFHATVLSVINNKEFIVVEGKHKHETQSRIDNILDKFDLGNRYFSKYIEKKESINYEKVNEKLNNMVLLDAEWLLGAIKGE